MVKKIACVFISGTGSNLNNLIKKSREYNFPIKIKLVISNNIHAYGIKYAKLNSIKYLLINNTRNSEQRILRELKKNKITLIILAGYMKISSKNLINLFGKKIINIHPSLLPKFKGLNTFSRVLESNEVKTGCTVHFVTEKLDSGKIITQKFFYLKKNDNVAELKRKTHNLEYLAFPEAIIKLYRNT